MGQRFPYEYVEEIELSINNTTHIENIATSHQINQNKTKQLGISKKETVLTKYKKRIFAKIIHEYNFDNIVNSDTNPTFNSSISRSLLLRYGRSI